MGTTVSFELNATTILLFVGSIMLGLLVWFLKRFIDQYDKKLEKLEAKASDIVTKNDFTLFRESTGQQLNGIASDTKTNQALLLALMKRDTKE